jgi:hypothetical protein
MSDFILSRYESYKRITGGHPEASALLVVAENLFQLEQTVKEVLGNLEIVEERPVGLTVTVNGEEVGCEGDLAPEREPEALEGKPAAGPQKAEPKGKKGGFEEEAKKALRQARGEAGGK